MEWERAKNYILIFFILLNLGLGGLRFFEDRQYTLSGDQERIIRNVLTQNNISMYRFPMRRFPPMLPIEMTGFYYDVPALIEILFPDPSQAMRIDDPSRIIYEDESREHRLVISNGFIAFDIFTPYVGALGGGAGISPAEARAIASEFVNRHFPSFVLDATRNVPNGMRLTFHEVYRDHIIYTNFVELLVTPEGMIRQIEMQFGRILGYTGTRSRIFSPDEALLTFVQRMHHIAQGEPIFIVRMDMAYFVDYTIGDQPGIPYVLVPFYRIFTLGDDDRAILINAFTNAIID